VNDSDFKERARRLAEVNGVISKLDEAIRADAFELLKDYVTAGASDDDANGDDGVNGDGKQQPRPRGGKFNPEALVEQHETDVDHDNATLVLAIFYGRHGRGPFKHAHLKAIATEFNITAVPDRMDIFLTGAKRGEPKASIIRKQADGMKVTTAGGTWLASKYGVSLGKQPLSS
jgi:hypothetical protein